MLILLIALAAAAPAPEVFEPSSKWIVNYEDIDCSLSRNLTGPSGQAIFGIYPSVDGFKAYVAILLPPGGAAPVSEVAVRFDNAPRFYDSLLFDATIAGAPRRMAKIVLDDPAGTISGSTAASVSIGGKERWRIQYGPTPNAIAALRTCQADLLKRWGVDPAALVPKLPPEEMVRLFPPDAYPKRAIKAHAQGRTVAAVAIDRDGTPKSCKPVVSAGNEALDATTCAIAMRGLRLPRATANDPPVRWLILPVRWVLPFIR